MRSDKPLIIVAVAIALSFLLPQAKACSEYIDRSLSLAKEQKEKLATDYWNANVEPLRQLCLRQGGIPTLYDIPGTGNYDWQVKCDYPPARPDPSTGERIQP